MHILVLANSLIPLPGLPTNGGGLRGWTLSKGLETAGFQVTLLFPRHSLTEHSARITAEARAAALPVTFDWNAVDDIIATVQPDLVVATGWALAGQIQHCPVPLVVDLAGPVLLEFLAQDWQKGIDLIHLKPRALARADYVICAGERQRRYFQPWLLLSGFSPDDCVTRLGVVSISCAPEMTPHQPPRQPPTILYAGTIAAWQDPTLAVHTTVDFLTARGAGELRFYTETHQALAAGANWFDTIYEQYRDHPHVTFAGTLPYEQLRLAYHDADLALDLFAPTLEREMAFNTRTVDYLHAGLPPIHSNYATLAGVIRDFGAGWVMAPEDSQALTAALTVAFDQPAELLARSRGAQQLARTLTWDQTIAPLVAFCNGATKRHPGPLTPQALMPDLVEELTDTQTELANTVIAADERLIYARHLEQLWAAQGRQLTTADEQLTTWRRHPWQQSARQTLAGLRQRLGRQRE